MLHQCRRTVTGLLVVNLSPSGAISAGAQWQVDGTGYNGSGQVVGYLTPGSHTVSFKPISGYTTPANQIVTINANAQTTASGTSGPASLGINNVLKLLGGGTVNLVAWQPGNSNYNAATPVLQSFNVSKIPQTITFGALSQQKVGDAPFSLYATSDSGLPMSLFCFRPGGFEWQYSHFDRLGNCYRNRFTIRQRFLHGGNECRAIVLRRSAGQYDCKSATIVQWQFSTGFLRSDEQQLYD